MAKNVRGLQRKIHDQLYVTISYVAQELRISPGSVLDWMSAPRKFPAGGKLQCVWISKRRWFLWSSVLEAKKLRPPHRRTWPRTTLAA